MICRIVCFFNDTATNEIYTLTLHEALPISTITGKLFALTFVRAFTEFAEVLVQELFDVEKGQLRKIPNFVIFLIYVLCLSVVVQAFMDAGLEGLILLGVVDKIPFRIDFLFLTLISTVIGIQTLRGMVHHRLDVTKNAIFLGMIVELALIVGDLAYLNKYMDLYENIEFLRLPFLVLTSMNLGILIYVATRMRVFRNGRGKISIL